ncbi:MAG: hypothetical protein D6B26_07770, partial [Spirochaetaceae bacterium]
MKRNSFWQAIAILVLIFFCPLLSTAQAHIHQFEHLRAEDGLSNSAISSIVQDESGFLWFGSQAGLHRYDGQEMRLFTAEPFNTKSLSNQLIQTLFLDGHELWVGTYGGLNLIDLRDYSITRFQHDPQDSNSLSDNVVIAIQKDSQGNLWVGTLNGLNRLDDQGSKHFTHFLPEEGSENSIPSNTIRALHLDSLGRFWVGSLGGLSEVIQQGQSITFHTVDSKSGLPSDYIMNILDADNGQLWLGAWGAGLVRYAPGAGEKGLVRQIIPAGNKQVYSLMQAHSGEMYIGTWGGGLTVYDPASGQKEEYQNDSTDPASLAHDIVYSIFQDQSGVIWIGTNGGGISKHDPTKNDFDLLRDNGIPTSILGTGRITHILALEDNRLMISTQSSGLVEIDLDSKQAVSHRHDPQNPVSISDDRVNSVFPEANGTFLVATHQGIQRFYPDENAFRPAMLANDPDSLLNGPHIFYDIDQSPDGSLWIASYNFGVFQRKPDGQTIQHSYSPDNPDGVSDNLIFQTLVDGQGATWAATNRGLCRFSPETGAWRQYLHDPEDLTSISADSTRTIFEDEQDRLWVGTRAGGLNLYQPASDSFI